MLKEPPLASAAAKTAEKAAAASVGSPLIPTSFLYAGVHQLREGRRTGRHDLAVLQPIATYPP